MSTSSPEWHLDTDRLRISRLQATDEDAAFLVELYNSPLFLAGQGPTGIDTNEKALKMITGFVNNLFAKRNHGIYLVSLRDRDDPNKCQKIGTVSIMIGGTHTVPDVGFALLPQYTGRGYAQEAGKAMVAYAIQPIGDGGLGYDGVFAFTSAGNAKSRKACASLDLEYRGIYRIKAFGGGESAAYAMPGMSKDLKKYGVEEDRLDD